MNKAISLLLLLVLTACGNPHVELADGETLTPPLEPETRVEDNTDETGDVTVDEDPSSQDGSGTGDEGDVDHHQDQGQREKVALIQDLTAAPKLPYSKSGRMITAPAPEAGPHGLVFSSLGGAQGLNLRLDGKAYLLKAYDCQGYVLKAKKTLSKKVRVSSPTIPLCHISLTSTETIEVEQFGWN